MRIIPSIDLGDRPTRNAFYLIVEIFWASILAAAASFNGAYAIRLGAANVEIGLLSSLPALLALLVSIPAGQFLQARARRKPWIVSALMVNRIGYLIVALVPFLTLAGLQQGALVVWIIALSSAGAHFFNVGFIPMLAEVTPEDRRATVFSMRNIVYNAFFSVCTLLFGLLLSRIEFPSNYQIMYAIGFVASCLSTYFLVKIDAPDATSMTKTQGFSQAFKVQVKTLRDAFTDHPEFIRITRNTFFYGIGLWLASPIYILYYVKSLNADDAWIGIQGTILSATTLIGYTIWRSLLKKWGEPAILKRIILTAGLYPILAGLLPSLNLILVVVALNGLLVPGINLSHFNTLLKVTPASNRPGYTALYITITNFGAFICPLIGVAIANLIGSGPALIIFGILSILGSSSFWFSPVQKEKVLAPAQPNIN